MIFSVVIPTCNRNDLLQNCLNLLVTEVNTAGLNSYEVIVSDDSKENIAKELIAEKFPWVKWVEGPKKGPAANRNNGARNASGSWLVFLDDDCLPQNKWLGEYASAVTSFSAKYEVFEGKTVANREKERFDEEAPINLEGGNLWSCNFCISKKLFWELDGFDEEFPFPAMEDVDFHLRVKRKGNILFLPTAVVVHPWRRLKPFNTFKKHLQSHAFFSKKHKSGFSLKRTYKKVKAFAGIVIFGFKELVGYGFKGWLYYIERSLLSFLLIFK